MIDALQAAVDELRIAPCSDELRAAFALRDRLDAALAEALGAFDAEGLWDLDDRSSLRD